MTEDCSEVWSGGWLLAPAEYSGFSPAADCGGLPSANFTMSAINWIISFSVFFAVPAGVALYTNHFRDAPEVEKKEERMLNKDSGHK